MSPCSRPHGHGVNNIGFALLLSAGQATSLVFGGGADPVHIRLGEIGNSSHRSFYPSVSSCSATRVAAKPAQSLFRELLLQLVDRVELHWLDTQSIPDQRLNGNSSHIWLSAAF